MVTIIVQIANLKMAYFCSDQRVQPFMVLFAKTSTMKNYYFSWLRYKMELFNRYSVPEKQ
jgi:hypothetical protein